MTTRHVSVPREFGTWEYHAKGPKEGGDQRCICTIETSGMVYVGIAIWTANSNAWFQNGTPLTGRVLAWMPLPEPAKGRWAHGKLICADDAILSRTTPSDDERAAMDDQEGGSRDGRWDEPSKTSAPRVVTDADVERAARALSLKQDGADVWDAMGEKARELWREDVRTVIESFATSLPAAMVPDGWVLIPRVADSSMRLAMAKADCESSDRYRLMAQAMIAAAPQAGEME